MTDRISNVPFLCTGSSARSILADRSHPKGVVDPSASKKLARSDVA